MRGIRAAGPGASKDIRLVRTGVHPSLVVEYFANLDAAIEQFFAGRLYVGDDQVQTLRGTWRRRRDVLAEDDRTSRTGGVNWITL